MNSMSKITCLKKSPSFVFNGIFPYVITYDHSSGQKGRYTVVIRTADDPVVIGRELDLPYVRKYIMEFERFHNGKGYFGDRRSALNAVKSFSKRH